MLEASTKELYAMFLDSRWWRDLSRAKRQSVGKCERCGGGDLLQSHHRFYRDNWFDTRPEDLEVLCRPRHEKEHGLAKPPQTQVPQFVRDVHRESWGQYFRTAPDPKLPQYRTMKDLARARSRHEISKHQFRVLRAQMPRIKKKNRVRRIRGHRRKYEVVSRPPKRGLNFRKRMNWVNRGSSSN